MSEITVKYFSNALNRNIRFEIHLPDDRESGELKTVLLLHGYTGDAYNWIPRELMQKYGFAVVTPNGENGFWLDGLSTGRKYSTLIAEELIGYLRRTFGLAKSADKTYIMGLSMGGFGTLHAALAYPDVFGKAAAMSSALIVHQIAYMKKGESTDLANYDYYHDCFGDLETVEESDKNPEILAEKLKKSSGKLPEIYMCCGTEDFLLEENRAFHAFLDSIGYTHVYFEDKGGHDMDFWERNTPKLIEMMFGE